MSDEITIIIITIFFFIGVEAQAQSLSEDSYDDESSTSINFQLSLAVVIGMISVMLLITFILILYAKLCHRTPVNINQIDEGPQRLSQPHRVSGINRAVIESLPFFRFSSLKGMSRQGLECSVCLAKFESVEILKLLPKCKHAFHIDCIDRWLEKHSTCPLCRHKVTKDDFSQLPYSNSFRFLWNSRSLDQREENVNGSSSRFSVASSFRKSEKGEKEGELPIQHCVDVSDYDDHNVVVSDAVVFEKRWSNVDLVFLNSKMLNDISSSRFSALDSRNGDRKTNLNDRRSEIVVLPRFNCDY